MQVLVRHIQAHMLRVIILIVFKYLNITMDKYVLHSYFHDIDMDEVYIILEHPWMKSIGTINIIAQNYCMKISIRK